MQNCSVPHSKMCAGKVKVLGKCDKTVGWYLWEMAVQLSVQTVYRYMVVTAVCVRGKTQRLVG